MPELILLIGITVTVLLYRNHIRTRIAKTFCLAVATLFVVGHGMNILVIRLNGNKMPVLDSGVSWENAPSIDLPDVVDDFVFEKYLPKAQKAIMLTDEPHRMVPKEKEKEIRLKWLADIHPIKIGSRTSLYSLGDVFIASAFLLLFIGIVPVWLLSRRGRKRASTP